MNRRPGDGRLDDFGLLCECSWVIGFFISGVVGIAAMSGRSAALAMQTPAWISDISAYWVNVIYASNTSKTGHRTLQ
jgi:hypothetical protein